MDEAVTYSPPEFRSLFPDGAIGPDSRAATVELGVSDKARPHTSGS